MNCPKSGAPWKTSSCAARMVKKMPKELAEDFHASETTVTLSNSQQLISPYTYSISKVSIIFRSSFRLVMLIKIISFLK